jgi:TonB family protein
MGADSKVQAAERPRDVRVRSVAPSSSQERAFWVGLACAAVLHAALIFGVTRSSPRQMGEKGGKADGISVMLVDAADLASKNTFAEDGSPAAARPATAEAAPNQARTLEEQKQKTPAPPMNKEPPVLASPADEAAKQGKVGKEQEQRTTAWPIDTQAPHQASPPDQAAKQGEAASKPAPRPQQKPATQQQPAPPQPQPTPPLQLSMPDMPIMPGGRSASFARPAGVTRSGENDEFGRGVIRALRQTFPTAGAVPGRVTVRLLLSEKGNLVEVRLVSSGGNPLLDQNVVFAVKQSNFPIPPVGSTLVDRTFLVTYIYN